ALGDPVPPRLDEPASPTPKPPDHGLLVQEVTPGSNAAQAGIRAGDILLRYAGARLGTRDDLQARIQAGDPKATLVSASIWGDGKPLEWTLKPGPLGIVLNPRPAAEALLAQREADARVRRTRSAAFDPLPGSRREVQAIAG